MDCYEVYRQKAIEQHQKTVAQREEKARKLIAQTGFEYVSGYVNTDSLVTIRCPECGNTFERSMITFRHHAVVRCPFCPEIKKRERKEALRLKKEQEKQERTECKRAEEERKRAEKLHPCPVCGEMTTRNKYCSKKCANRVENSYKEAKRRAKLKGALVDKDITLERLYVRDKGVCLLCGGECDWNDYVIEDGTVIARDNYPSIDHIIPLAKGGKHEWKNVQLAHRKCNWEKSDTLPPSEDRAYT